MQPAPWRITGRTAQLDLPRLSLTLDADFPADGLKDITVSGQCWQDARLLRIAESTLNADSALDDWLVRGDELLAVYEVASPHAARVDLSWQAVAARERDPWFARIDLLVSVRTDRLDWRHDVYLESDVPGSTVSCEPLDRRGCQFFLRDQFSYAEFVHPADLREDEVISTGGGPARISLRRRLFPPESLEKGVILRARVRSLFLPPAAPPLTAARCYDEFIAADPPLGG